MSESNGNGQHNHLHEAVRLHEERSEQWKQQGERSIWQNISMIGALGWLIVVPLLICTFIGRWLDRTFESGIFYSGTMIFVGVCLGAYLAWQRIHKE